MKQHSDLCDNFVGKPCDCYLSRGGEPPPGLCLARDDRAVCPWCGEILEMHQMDFKPEEGDDYECPGCQRTFTLKKVRCVAVITTAKKK